MVLRDLDVNRLRAFPLQLRNHLLGHPEIPLLVGRQHTDTRTGRARFHKLRARILGDSASRFGRLAQANLEIHIRAGFHLRQDAGLELRPEVVDFPGDLHRVVEDSDGVGDAGARDFHGRGHAGALDLLGQVLVERGIGALDIQLDVERFERLPHHVRQHRVEVGVDLARLTRRVARLEESIRLLRDLGERDRSACVVPHVRQMAGEIHRRRFRTRRVGSGHDRRSGAAEGSRHDFHRAFAGPEIVEARFADLDQPLHQRVRAADENRIRLALRRPHFVGHARQRKGDAGGLEPEARGDVRRAERIGRRSEHDGRVGAIGNQIGVGIAVPAVDRQRICEIEIARGRRSAAACGSAAIAGRIRRELVGIDRRRQRPLVQTRARHLRMAGHFGVAHEIDRGRRDVREVERLRLLTAPVCEIEVLERLRRAHGVAFRHIDAKVHPRHAALVAVDEHRGDARCAAGDPVKAQIADRLIADRGQRDPAHPPCTRQACRQLDARIERPLIVSADDDESRCAGAERRGDGRDETLSRFQAREIDRALIAEPLHEAILAADENRHTDRRRLRDVVVAHDQRQRQRRRLVPETRRQVRGGLEITDGRIGGHDDSSSHDVGETIAVGVARQAVHADECVERHRMMHVGDGAHAALRRQGHNGDSDCQQQNSPCHDALLWKVRRNVRDLWREILPVQNKRASRYCDAPLLHWSGSPSIHGALP